MIKGEVRTSSLSPSRAGRLAIFVGIPVLFLLLVFLLRQTYVQWFLPDRSWTSYPAQVVNTRVVRATVVETSHGSSFLYRVEVDAVWTDNGGPHEAWIPTEKTDRDQAWLALWASQQSKHCIVRQSPGNPSARLAFFVTSY